MDNELVKTVETITTKLREYKKQLSVACTIRDKDIKELKATTYLNVTTYDLNLSLWDRRAVIDFVISTLQDHIKEIESNLLNHTYGTI